MQERLDLRCQSAHSLSDMTAALERAAILHSIDLQIDHDRMLSRYGVLWMLMRMRLTVKRFPEGEFTVQTFLRKPSSVASNRDFLLSDEKGEFGSAVQTWVLVHAAERRLAPMNTVPELQNGPFPQPERTGQLRRLILPQTAPAALWTVTPDQIDSNGHLNNVHYIRHAEALAPAGCTGLEIMFDRECFVGETLRLESADCDSFFVRGVKENGEESFRARFWKEDSQ